MDRNKCIVRTLPLAGLDIDPAERCSGGTCERMSNKALRRRSVLNLNVLSHSEDLT